MKNLRDYLKHAKHRGFHPRVRYYPWGDFMTYFAKEDRCVAKRVDRRLIVYRSIKDDSIVGIKILNPSADINCGERGGD